jgi:hypothetical protein
VPSALSFHGVTKLQMYEEIATVNGQLELRNYMFLYRRRIRLS